MIVQLTAVEFQVAQIETVQLPPVSTLTVRLIAVARRPGMRPGSIGRRAQHGNA
jgi:hypothetical protein